MSDWTTVFKSRLIEDEKLLGVIDNLQFDEVTRDLSSATGSEYYGLNSDGAIALSNHRLSAVWKSRRDWGWLSISAWSRISEYQKQIDNANSHSQFTLYLPDGSSLITQTMLSNGKVNL